MKPLQGNHGGRPPVDPSSAEHMAKDAAANAATDAASKPASDIAQQRRTRPPASVRVKEGLEHEADLARGSVAGPAWTGTLPHTAPTVATREAHEVDDEWLTAQVLKLRSGLAARALDQIGNAVQAMADAGLRFDREPLVSHPAAEAFRSSAALRALQSPGRHDVAARIAMRLIDLGCDPNACDDMHNTVLMYAAKFGDAAFVEFLLADCPELALHRLNFYGLNAAMIARANGNTVVLGQLTDAGVSLNPPNAALIFYQSGRERFSGPNAQEAYDQLWRLLQRTHYINLADATGKTLIFHAVLNQDVDMVRFLCSRSDYPDLSLRDHQRKSVFDYAALIGDDMKRKHILQALKALRSEIRPLSDLRMQDL